MPNIQFCDQSRDNRRLQPDRSFTRDKRLLHARDYQAVFNAAEFRVSHANLLLLATTNHSGNTRLGLVVAKKNVRSAVARNRIKRVVRETFRRCEENIAGVDIVFLARRGLDRLQPEEQTGLLQQSWRRLAKKVAAARRAGG